MAKMTTQDLLAVFEEMTVLELKDFLDAFEERFEVTAAAPMAMAAAPAAGGDGAAAAVEEEKDEFDVVITAIGDKKIQVIKEVRTLTSLGLQGGQGAGGERPQGGTRGRRQGSRREGQGTPRGRRGDHRTEVSGGSPRTLLQFWADSR